MIENRGGLISEPRPTETIIKEVYKEHTETKRDMEFKDSELELAKDFILLLQFLLSIVAYYIKNEVLIFMLIVFVILTWIIRTLIKKKLRLLYFTQKGRV